jgi:hypothetical protein
VTGYGQRPYVMEYDNDFAKQLAQARSRDAVEIETFHQPKP